MVLLRGGRSGFFLKRADPKTGRSAPGSPLGARSGPPPPRPAVTPALGDTGHERRPAGRPGLRALRSGAAEAAPAARGALAPARRGGGGGAGPAGNCGPGRRHFSRWQRRGRGRGDFGHGERLRLRLRLRRRRRREAGPGAHHGAGEGADRRGQRTGALAADDGQVLSEVHREARRRPGQLRAEVHRHVHGPVHGLLEHSFASLQFSAAAGESQHVTPAGLRAERDHVGKRRAAGQSRWLGVNPAAFSCSLSWQSNKTSLNLLHPLAFISTSSRRV